MSVVIPKVVAVTGGFGFVGRYLVAIHLAQGIRVRVLSRSRVAPTGSRENLEHFVGDLGRDAGSLDAFLDGADVLYHCAGEIRVLQRMREVHVGGTQRLLDAAAGRVRHWVQLSSAGVYGRPRSGVIQEETPFAPDGEYETTKAESERLVATVAVARGMSFSVLRPSIVFGTDMPNGSLHQFVKMIDRNLFFFVGPVGANAPYVAVEEVARALWLCGTRSEAQNQAYNLSENLTIEEFVVAIARALDRPTPYYRLPESLARMAAMIGNVVPRFPLTSGRVDALTSRAVYDSSKIARELGFAPQTPVLQRLGRFVRHIRAGGE